MKRILVCLMVVAALAALSMSPGINAQQKEPPKEAPPAVQIELKLLEGTWQLTSREVDGQREDLQGMVIRAVVKDGKYTVQINDTVVDQGAFKIDPTTKPKSLDSIPETGDNKGKTILAVYDVTPEELRLCVAPEGSKRPTELAAKQGTGHILNIYKRQPPAKQ
jgi:uncharacterized protein (TIGR03067 family)